MSAYLMEAPIELTDDQLDIISAGARQPKQEGLVNVNVEDVNVNVAAVVFGRNTPIDIVNE
jgi:hypothetical protein